MRIRLSALCSRAVVTYVWAAVNKLSEERIVVRDDGVDVENLLWDNNNVLRETDDLGTVQAEYTYQPEPYGDLISDHRDSESNYYRFDALGNTTGLTDAAGNVTDEFHYTAFGKDAATSGTTETPYRWIGQLGYRQDDATGLNNLRARDYDPTTGQFTSQDPLGLAAGDSNFYRYVANDPANQSDPSGLESAATLLGPRGDQQLTLQCTQPYPSEQSRCDLREMVDREHWNLGTGTSSSIGGHLRFQEYCRLYNEVMAHQGPLPLPVPVPISPRDYCDTSTLWGQELYRRFLELSEADQLQQIQFLREMLAGYEEEGRREELRQSAGTIGPLSPSEQARFDFECRWQNVNVNDIGTAFAMRHERLMLAGEIGAARSERLTFLLEHLIGPFVGWLPGEFDVRYCLIDEDASVFAASRPFITERCEPGCGPTTFQRIPSFPPPRWRPWRTLRQGRGGSGDFYQNDEPGGIYGSLNADDLIEFRVDRSRYSTGTQLFDRMMTHYGCNARGIMGNWSRSSDNLTTINRLTSQGMSLIDACRHTFTGRLAAEWGFENVSVISATGTPGAYEHVVVTFQ